MHHECVPAYIQLHERTGIKLAIEQKEKRRRGRRATRVLCSIPASSTRSFFSSDNSAIQQQFLFRRGNMLSRPRGPDADLNGRHSTNGATAKDTLGRTSARLPPVCASAASSLPRLTRPFPTTTSSLFPLQLSQSSLP